MECRSQSQTPSLSQSSQRQRTKLNEDLTTDDVHLKLIVDSARKSQLQAEPARSQPVRSSASLLFVSDGTRGTSYNQQYSHSPMDALTVSQEDPPSQFSSTKLGVTETLNVSSSVAK